MTSTKELRSRSGGQGSLRDLLDEKRIVIPLPADSLETALEALGAGFAATGSADLRAEIAELEAGDLVALGEGAVLAHRRTDAVERVGLAIGVAEVPLPFAPETARSARCLFLVVSPPAGTRRYLQTLGALSRVLRGRELTERLLEADAPGDVLRIPALREPVLGPDLVVRDVMTVDVVSTGPDLSLAEVADLMVHRRLRALPVVNDEREVMGLITDRQVMEYFLPRIGGAEDPGSSREPSALVRDVMLRSVLCVKEDERLHDVAALMINKDVERFPVCAEGALVGFLTRGDILRKLLGRGTTNRSIGRGSR